LVNLTCCNEGNELYLREFPNPGSLASSNFNVCVYKTVLANKVRGESSSLSEIVAKVNIENTITTSTPTPHESFSDLMSSI
jgi:hypothetical protein